MVQVEAMLNNVPCVASALPGVRQPVTMHGMGKIVPIGEPSALAEVLLAIFAEKEKYRCDTAELIRLYDPNRVAQEYEKLFEELLRKKGKGTRNE